VCRLRVRVTPGARASAITGIEDGELRVRIAAPASEGKANRALLEFLASQLGVPRSRLSVRYGKAGRIKLLEIDGLELSQILETLTSQDGGCV
jgi:uncharacterized protein